MYEHFFCYISVCALRNVHDSKVAKKKYSLMCRSNFFESTFLAQRNRKMLMLLFPRKTMHDTVDFHLPSHKMYDETNGSRKYVSNMNSKKWYKSENNINLNVFLIKWNHSIAHKNVWNFHEFTSSVFYLDSLSTYLKRKRNVDSVDGTLCEEKCLLSVYSFFSIFAATNCSA